MKLFNNNIVPYASTEGDKIYPIVVDIKKGIKSGEAISFVTADNQVGVITVDFMDGNSSYSIEGCMVTSTIHRPDGTVLEILCDIISQSTIEIPLGINGTYQEGVHTFDLKIVRGNGKIIGVPTMSYSVSGSLSSDDVVEGDDRLPVLTMVLDNAQDKLTRLDKAIAGATNDLEVKEARDGEVTLNARLERDLEKGKIHFVDIEGSNISTESQEGYLENVEILGNTWQDSENLADIRSVGTKVEGQELYEIPVLSIGKNLFNNELEQGTYAYNGSIKILADGEVRNVNPIYVKGGSTICFTSNTNVGIIVWEYNSLGVCELKSPTSVSINVGFKLREDTEYINFRLATGDENFLLQIEEGIQSTPYEPYQEDKLTILSPTPLEKVGDIADRIICKDGVWGVEKNVVNLTFTGIENWRIDTNGTFYMSSSEWKGVPHKPNCICITDIFASAMNTNDINDKMFMGNSYLFMIKPSGISSVNDWKSYLNANNLKVKYATTQPQFVPIPHSQQIKLRTFADRTHIRFDTEIEGTIKAQVPKSLGATVNTHTTQIDNLNKELDRVKKLEESTVSTVTSSKAFTTVSETSGGYFEDVKIEGKTLVNLHPINYKVSGNYRYPTDLTYHLQTNEKDKKAFDSIIKPSTTYTVILDDIIEEVSHIYLMGMLIQRTGRVTKITTPSSLSPAYFHIYIRGRSYTEEEYGEFKSKLSNIKVTILEGDHTDKDITFFEGIKSVGQDTDEISVSSVNGNLFDGELVPNNIDIGNMGTDNICSKNFIPVVSGVEYTLMSDSNYNFELYFYDKNLKGVPSLGLNIHYNYKKPIFTVPQGYEYIRFRTWSNENNTNIKVWLSNKGECDYIEPKQDKNQILYYNPTTQTWEKPVLREWDSIEKHNDGKYYYHKRSGEVVLNGSENWSPSSSNGTLTDVVAFYMNNTLSCITDSLVICDKIPSIIRGVAGVEYDNIYISTTGRVNINILKSKLSTQDVTGFKAWLQANNITVVYQLAQEEVYECTNLDLITYSGETNLIVNSGAIQPKLNLKVLSNVSNVVKLLQEKVSVLENKFIEGLKQVLSGDMMSLAHLLYPEDFENNHEIQTLEL